MPGFKPGLTNGITLPVIGQQTTYLSLDSSVGNGTWARASNAWNPETGAIAPHNLMLNSAVFVTQSVTLTAQPHVLSFKGTGTITLGGTGSGTLAGTGASNLVTLTFTPTAGSVSFTLSGGAGTVTECQLNVQSLTSYVPTTTAAVYSPRYVTGKSGQALLVEESASNKVTVHSVPRIDQYGATLNSGTAALGKVYEIVVRTGVDWEAVATRLSGTANTAGAKYLITGVLTFDADDTAKEAIDYVGTKAYHNGTAFQNPITSMTLSGDTAAVLSIVTDQAAIDAAIALNPTDGSMVALQAAKANGYKVYKLDNSAGSVAAVVAIAGLTGNTNPHTYNIVTRKISGGATTIRLNATGKAITSTAYNIDGEANLTPSDTSRVVRVDVAATGVIHFISPSLTETAYATSPILTSGAATTRAAESVTYNTAGVVAAPTTIEGWFNFEGVSAGKVQTLWSTYTGAADYTRIVYSGTQLIFTKAKTGQTTETIAHTVTLTPATWYHVAITLAADGTAIMYLNGTAVGTNGTTAAFVPVIASTMQVGSYNSTLQANGYLDNWRFFSRVLTANEIQTYYNRGK